jgi:hypothetical protein
MFVAICLLHSCIRRLPSRLHLDSSPERIVSENEANIHGKTARKLGGILQGGSIVHFAEPHYLLTPDQFKFLDENPQETIGNEVSPPEPILTTNDKSSSTRSSLSAHATSNYLQGISRESRDHPLVTDFPPSVRAYLGEAEPLLISV